MTSSDREQEIRSTHDRFLQVRGAIERGERPWSDLGEFFTDDAYYVDPAWGRVEGKVAILRFLDESMRGLEGWVFPTQWTMVDGDRLVSCWLNRLPGQRADGSFYQAPGISLIQYAGNGRFSSSEDLLNMVHVFELIRESGWKPGPGALPPPRQPRR
jgi:ketosteroid isomerase-like protein